MSLFLPMNDRAEKTILYSASFIVSSIVNKIFTNVLTHHINSARMTSLVNCIGKKIH